MLYHLLAPLGKQYILFNLFNYISFRAAGATVTALLLAFVVGPAIIARLRAHKIGQVIRAEGPASHQGKRGTPTMGGLIILLATVVPTLLWARLDNRFVLFALLATLWMGGIGFLDDYLKIVQGKSRGLVAQWKLAGQVTFGVALGLCCCIFPVVPVDTIPATATTLPFFKYLVVNFAPLAVRRLRHAGHHRQQQRREPHRRPRRPGRRAPAIAAGAFAVFAYLLGRVDATGYLNLFYLPGRRGARRVLRGAHGRLHSASSGSTPTRRRCSWATPAAWRSAAPSARWRSCSRRSSCCCIIGGVFVAEAVSVILQTVGLQVVQADAGARSTPMRTGCSAWRRCITTSRSWAGTRPRW